MDRLDKILPRMLTRQREKFALESRVEVSGFDSEGMDRRVDPGKDFYGFANGGWLKRTRIPLKKRARGTLIELQERTDAVLFEILEECATEARNRGAAAGSVRQLLGDFYAGGMDKAQINMAGVVPLKPLLDRIAQISDLKQLAEMLGYLHQHGVKALFEIGLEQNLEGAAIQFGSIECGGLGMPSPGHYLSDDKLSSFVRKRYVHHIANMFRLLGDPKAVATTRARGALSFETELGNAIQKGYYEARSEVPSPYYDPDRAVPASATELVAATPGFDWQAYFRGLGLQENQLEWLRVPDGLSVLRTIELVEKTPLDVSREYLRWHLIRRTAPHLSDAFVKEHRRIQPWIFETLKNLPRTQRERILSEINSSLGHALGQLFVERTFTAETRQRVQAIAQEILETFRSGFRNGKWIGPKSQETALKRVDTLDVQIGYPNKWHNYSGLEIKDQPHILNVFAATTFETKRQLAMIGKPIDRAVWPPDINPQTVNAFARKDRHQVIVPAAWVQPPHYNVHVDEVANYAGVGNTLAHEIWHVFERTTVQLLQAIQPLKFETNDNYLSSWLAPEESYYIPPFETEVSMEFGRYRVGRRYLNGAQVTQESLADIVGAGTAFAALTSVYQRKPAAERSVRVDGFNWQQRYFLTLAMVQRKKTGRPLLLFSQWQNDVHAPYKFRVNGSLRHIPEFAQAFNLPPDSPMISPRPQLVWQASAYQGAVQLPRLDNVKPEKHPHSRIRKGYGV
jgi:putative endopeptidase